MCAAQYYTGIIWKLCLRWVPQRDKLFLKKNSIFYQGQKNSLISNFPVFIRAELIPIANLVILQVLYYHPGGGHGVPQLQAKLYQHRQRRHDCGPAPPEGIPGQQCHVLPRPGYHGACLCWFYSRPDDTHQGDQEGGGGGLARMPARMTSMTASMRPPALCSTHHWTRDEFHIGKRNLGK